MKRNILLLTFILFLSGVHWGQAVEKRIGYEQFVNHDSAAGTILYCMGQRGEKKKSCALMQREIFLLETNITTTTKDD